MILGAAILSYFLRYRVETLPVLFELSFQDFLQLVLIAIPFLLLLFGLNGLYHQKSTRSFLRELSRVAVAVSAALMIVVVLFFFDRNLFPSRLIILMGWIFTIIFVVLGRGTLLLLQRRLLDRGLGRHRLFVVQGAHTHQIIDEILGDSRLGYEVVERTSYSDTLLLHIERLHRQQRIDELLQADTRLTSEQNLALVNFCEQLGIKLIYLPSILETRRANIETDVIGSTPVIRLKTTPLDGWGKVVKRIIDVFASLLALILFSPLFLLILIIIKLDSKGPVFFHQRRGSSYHNFEFYKFRSMHSELSEGTPEGDLVRSRLEKINSRSGPYVKIKNDPRVTRVGRFLRRTKLDELPQLWHVLRGQMSLVGPRIHMMKEVEKFENQYKKIFTIKPGATGLAQLSQMRDPELAFGDEIELDLFYIENWSVWLDVYIVFKTLLLLLTRKPRADY
ncbi:MAG: exopolysaccharide biosynthesis polyprenyl glycosylphosphotransferase [bacterium]|nr:exopolysaccharide biosynthesis polyprenyl glycosylphosphotransferase [bacterium]